MKYIHIVHEDKHDSHWHSHAEGQLFIMQTGLLIFQLKDQRILIPAGQAGWVAPKAEHKAKTIGPVTADFIYLNGKTCEHLDHSFVFTPSTLMLEISKRIAKKSQRNLLPVLLDELEQATLAPLCLMMPKDKHLERVAKLFLRHPELNQSLEDWARQAHTSKRSFTRHFRAETGLSFAQWCQQARVMKALEYLTAGKSVTWIAMTLGYNSVSAFIKVFKAWLGVTPSRYASSSH